MKDVVWVKYNKKKHCEHKNHYVCLDNGSLYCLECDSRIKLLAKEVKMPNTNDIVKDALCPYCFDGKVVYNEISQIFHCHYCKKQVNIDNYVKNLNNLNNESIQK